MTKVTTLAQLESVNVLAILLDVVPRSYAKFRVIALQNDLSENENCSSEQENSFEPLLEGTSMVKNKSIKDDKKLNLRKKMWIGVAVVVGICSLKFILLTKNYMVWQKNQYVAVDCDDVKQGFVTSNVQPINEQYIKNFKKIEVARSIIFFKNGQPIVWYGKSFEGKHEFFSSFGFHPEAHKTLRPTSWHIIKKYIKR